MTTTNDVQVSELDFDKDIDIIAIVLDCYESWKQGNIDKSLEDMNSRYADLWFGSQSENGDGKISEKDRDIFRAEKTAMIHLFSKLVQDRLFASLLKEKYLKYLEYLSVE